MIKQNELRVVLKSNVLIYKPSTDILYRIIDANTFKNPKFISNEYHGYSNWQTPKIIETFKNFPGGVAVPKGYTLDLLRICREEGAQVEVEDLRSTQEAIFPQLNVQLRSYQQRAVDEALKAEQGVVVAPTGSGKTLIGLSIVKDRRQKALIIVHRAELAKQWIDVIRDRFCIEAGLISDGIFELGDLITVAMVQTLVSREEETKRITETFGLVLVDECHHVPAETFTEVIGWFPSKYTYGLSATLKRSDGLEQMIYRAIGEPISTISKVDVESLGATVPVSVKCLQTGFNPGFVSSWNTYLDTLIKATKRNEFIIDLARGEKASVLILCDRVAHAEQLSEMFTREGVDHVLAHGKLKGDERAAAMQRMKTGHITIGTTGLLGEGLDVSSWGVLIMASPVSSEIKLMQAIGRIVRPGNDKESALVLDLRDDCGFSGSSFKKRFEIYKKHKIWVTF